ncbi:MAG: serine--tRNA ligase, partial [Hyphomicrobium sp.]
MFDIKSIRDNPQAFDAALKRRGLEPLSAKLIALDEGRRANLTTLQDAQSRRNAVSKDIGKAKGAKDEALAAKLMAEVASLKDIIAKGEEQERTDNSAVEAALAIIPNLPLAEVPDGKDEKDNKEVRRWGQPTKPVESP